MEMNHVHRPNRSIHVSGALLGILAAALFGLSSPLAKLLLDSIAPTLLAGLLYLGAAVGLWSFRLLSQRTHEAQLRRADKMNAGPAAF